MSESIIERESPVIRGAESGIQDPELMSLLLNGVSPVESHYMGGLSRTERDLFASAPHSVRHNMVMRYLAAKEDTEGLARLEAHENLRGVLEFINQSSLKKKDIHFPYMGDMWPKIDQRFRAGMYTMAAWKSANLYFPQPEELDTERPYRAGRIADTNVNIQYVRCPNGEVVSVRYSLSKVPRLVAVRVG